MAALTHGPVDIERMRAEAARPDCGAIVVFLGTTRNHHQGRKVARLAYEAYEPMAATALEAIEHSARERFEIAHCAISHRLGEVAIEQASVCVVVAAAHRAPAFDAARWAMDELKRSVPIWKKEIYESGDAAWVDGTRLAREPGTRTE